MDVPSGKWSIGALMLLIGLLALELVVFEGVWSILLIPFMAIGLITINLGLVFVLVRPQSWQTRIVGMLLGGLAAIFAALALTLWEIRLGLPGVLASMARIRMEGWAASLPDPGGPSASTLLFIGRHTFKIEAMVVNLIGLAMIWAGARLDHSLRRHRAASRIASDATDPRGEPAPAA